MDVEAIFSKSQLLQHCEAVVVGPIDLYLLVYRYISFAHTLGFSNCFKFDYTFKEVSVN